MEFEEPKTEWKNQKLEGYLFDETPLEIVEDIRRKAGSMRWKNIQRDVVEILVGILCIAAFSLLLESGQPPIARTGAILMMAGVMGNAIAFVVPRYRYRHKRYDLRWTEIFEQERRKLLARIRLVMGCTTWHAAPLVAGLILYMVGYGLSFLEWLIAISQLALIRGYSHLLNRRIRRELAPLPDEIDRELTAMRATIA
jgi:Na+/melibiose symporter-like transporter